MSFVSPEHHFSVPKLYHPALAVMVWPPAHSTFSISFLSFWPLSLPFHKCIEDDPSVSPHDIDVTYVPLTNLSIERHQWRDGDVDQT